MSKKKSTDQDAAAETPVKAAKSPAAAAGKTAQCGNHAGRATACAREKENTETGKKNKSRLPRRQKKAQQKAQQKAANRQ